MRKPDPLAEELDRLLDEPPSPKELERMSGPAATEARTATHLRQTLAAVQPDGEFVAQLETRLRATGCSPASPASARAWLGWMLAVTVGLLLLALTLAAVILVPVLTQGHPEPLNASIPMLPSQNPPGTQVQPPDPSNYILSSRLVLPAAPPRVPVLRQSTQAWGEEEVRRIAIQIGLRQPLTITHISSADYTVHDDTREVIFSENLGNLIHYEYPGVSLQGTGATIAQATQATEAFLKAGGLLNFPYRVEPDPQQKGVVHIVRLVDGRPVRNAGVVYDARAEVSAGGSVGVASYYSRTIETAGDVSILSAAEAWEAFRQGRASAWANSTRPVSGSVALENSTRVNAAYPISLLPPITSAGDVEMIKGRLSAVVWEYQGTVTNTQRISASLWGWITPTQMETGWRVELSGPHLRGLAQLDGLRVKVWGRYDAASHTMEVDRYEQADPTEHVQAWLGVVTTTVMDDGVMRTFFTTRDGQRFVMARSLQCPVGQMICLMNAPTDRVVIMEGAVGQEAFQGMTVLYDLGYQSGDTDMTERELDSRPARPHVERETASDPGATAAPLPTSLAPSTSPYQPGQRVDGMEGYVSSVIRYCLPSGPMVGAQADLAVLPLNGIAWSATLMGAEVKSPARYDGTRARVWGYFTRDANNRPVIEVERFERVDPAEQVQAWLGTFVTATLGGRTMLALQTRDGPQYVLASSVLAPLSSSAYAQEYGWGGQVIVEGTLRPETFMGRPVIQEHARRANPAVDLLTDLKGYRIPLPACGPGEPGHTPMGLVEQAELIYYADARPSGDPNPVILRPVWRFAGHASDGSLFEVLIDAVRPTPARVTLDVPAVQPMPSWSLEGTQAAELRAMLTALTPTQPPPAEMIGSDRYRYSGILIDLPDAASGATQRVRVFDGVVAGMGDFKADPQRRLERWLLRSGLSLIDGVLYSDLSQEIDAAFPTACSPAPAVSLIVTPVNASEVEVSVTGLQADEPVSFIFESHSVSETATITIEPLARADTAGRFVLQRPERERLRRLKQNEVNRWLVKVIHRRGINCVTVVLP